VTRLGAFLAVLHLVLRAFFAARFANLGAELADMFGKDRAAGHLSFREGTDVGATSVQFDAAGHHADIVFVQARRCAVFTRLHAVMAGFDTILVFLVRHRFSLG
jgi:hypothetical protein